MMESILDVLGDIAEVGTDYMIGKRKDFLVGKKNKDSEENTEFEEERDHFKTDGLNQGIGLKKKKGISQAKAKKLPTLKEQEQSHQIQQRQAVTQQSGIKGISDINQTKLQEGIILSEILGPPVSRKRRNRIGRV